MLIVTTFEVPNKRIVETLESLKETPLGRDILART